MESILTLTLNPTIDVSTSVGRLAPIHKLRCGPARRDPGGGGINVARVVRRLGTHAIAVYPTGGLIGALLYKLTSEEGVENRTVPIAGETREDFTVLEEASGQQYRFILPGPHLSEGEWTACLDAVLSFDGLPRFIVASGSLPPGVPAGFFATLAKAVRQKGAKLVVDSTGPVLKAALPEGVHLIKPNLNELRDLMDEPLVCKADWLDASRRLIAAHGLERVALTLGEGGAMLVARDEAWFAEGLPVKPVSAVGAGDSFLGAMVWALNAGRSNEEALRYGVAAGSAAVLAPGTALCSKDDIERLLLEVKVTPCG